jgi:tRNA dimethylallyltransferase
MKPIIIVTGPTTSGKTGFAVDLALKLRGEIINADSLQVYKENPIISAQPTVEEQKDIAHHLFGYVSGDEEYNVARWIKDAIEVINKSKSTPIIVGGTGLYIKHLIFGLSNIPDISFKTKEEAKELLEKIGNENFYATLKNVDPISAAKISPNNIKKMLRSYEVYKETGKAHSSWESTPYFPLERFKLVILEPDREMIYPKCNQRFLEMLENGVLEEVENLKNQNYNPLMGIMKSHGVPELVKYLNGEYSLTEAIDKSQQVTRNYAKRQLTWNKHQYNHPQLARIVIRNPKTEFSSALEFCKK